MKTLARETVERKDRDRPAKEPGGCECIVCGEVFIGEPWHEFCALCLKSANQWKGSGGEGKQI